MNKKKIINDPIYGFITIPGELIYDIIEHPYFQRLRRIKQLGLADYTYPGALHTRFHHALGAMHLMGLALNNIRSKGHKITREEMEAAQLAVLLHDIGHGPYSHALEHTLLDHVKHEAISLIIIKELNKVFNHRLDLTIEMFTNQYSRQFFYQLISSQLDIDRLDYLQRDSFFTGVSEGTIGADRIIKMLEVVDGQIVIEEKGIYSIENFLNARRLMYWQVYLHKKVLSAERMVIKIIERARYLIQHQIPLEASPPLLHFLKNKVSVEEMESNPVHINYFTTLDDYDIWGAIKAWAENSDKILSVLSRQLLNRVLFKVEISNDPPAEKKIIQMAKAIEVQFNVSSEEVHYMLNTGMISNEAYQSRGYGINIYMKNRSVVDIAKASDLPNIKALSQIVKKHYICWPKHLYL